MKEEQIFDELNGTIQSKKVDFESLRAAVETRKLVHELEGIKLSRILAVLSLFVSVSLLAWQGFQTWDDNNIKIRDMHKELLNERIKKLDEDLSEKRSRYNELTVDVSNLQKQVDILTKETDKLSKIKLEINDLTKTRDGLNQQVNRLHSIADKKKSLNEELKKLHAAEEKIVNLENSVLQLRNTNADISHALTQYRMLGNYNFVQFKKDKINTTRKIEKYNITFKNVGNVRKNIDLLVESPRGKRTRINNLDNGFTYTFRFDKKTFFVMVDEVNKAPKKKNESGSFRVVMLDIDSLLVN